MENHDSVITLLLLPLNLSLTGMPTAMSTPMMFQQLGRDAALNVLAESLIYQHTISLITLTVVIACSMYYAILNA